MKDEISYYDIVGVSDSASAEDIRLAYRSAARRLHPDADGNARQFDALRKAYGVLGDPARRLEYDRRRTAASPTFVDVNEKSTAGSSAPTGEQPEWGQEDAWVTTPDGPAKHANGAPAPNYGQDSDLRAGKAVPIRHPTPVLAPRRRWGVIAAGLLASITVLAPWVLGRFVLRDMRSETEPEIFDVRARSLETYFLTDWLSGVAVLGLLCALIVLLPRWRGRVAEIVAACLLIALVVIVIIPKSGEAWRDAEYRTAEVLRSTVPDELYEDSGCGSATLPKVWAMYGASYSSGGPCSMIRTYHGWKLVAEVQTGPLTSPLIGIPSGGWSAKTRQSEIAVYAQSGDSFVGVFLSKPTIRWRIPSKATEIVTIGPEIVMTVSGQRVSQGFLDNGKLAGWNISSKKLWTWKCPSATSPVMNVDADLPIENGRYVDVSCYPEGGPDNIGLPILDYRVDYKGHATKRNN